MKYILTTLLLFPILGQAAAREAWSPEPEPKSAAPAIPAPIATQLADYTDYSETQLKALAAFAAKIQEKGRQMAAANSILFELEKELKHTPAFRGAAGDPEEGPLHEAKDMLTNFEFFNFEVFNELIEGIRESLTSGGAKK